MTGAVTMSSGEEDDQDALLLSEWRRAIPDTVPAFNLISKNVIYCEKASNGRETSVGNEAECVEETVDSFPCDCQYSPGLDVSSSHFRGSQRFLCLWSLEQVYQ